jgi:HAD superfamily hydrolase (TIGR01484 family)
MKRLLLCTDLDRTLLPNGREPESPGARDAFARLASRSGVRLVYVTGRDPGLVDEALATWGVPVPDVLIADVGTTIASPAGGSWSRWRSWDETIAEDWAGRTVPDLQDLLAGVPGLVLQDPRRQADFKLSYFIRTEADDPNTLATVEERLVAAGVRASVIRSVDDSTDERLLDVLPASASKRLGLEFVMATWGIDPAEVLFAGDSGNDLDVLISAIPAVLVANADPRLKNEARAKAAAAGHGSFLYLAAGGVLGMNGNYAAGILEGLLHFFPDRAEWLQGEK